MNKMEKFYAAYRNNGVRYYKIVLGVIEKIKLSEDTTILVGFTEQGEMLQAIDIMSGLLLQFSAKTAKTFDEFVSYVKTDSIFHDQMIEELSKSSYLQAVEHLYDYRSSRDFVIENIRIEV